MENDPKIIIKYQSTLILQNYSVEKAPVNDDEDPYHTVAFLICSRLQFYHLRQGTLHPQNCPDAVYVLLQ